MARRVRRGVKARRVVRRFELWSVAKLALVFHLFCYALTVAVLVVLWNVAFKLGTITKLETFLSDFGFSDKVSKQDFRLHGDAIFRAGAMAGLGLVALNTLATVLLAFFYNGVSGLFGGVVVSVLEERPPLSPAERRAVSADGRGERLALPSGSVDPVAGKRLRRRVRRKREQAAEAAAKAEASAVLMASGPILAGHEGQARVRKTKAIPSAVSAAPTESSLPPSEPTAGKPRAKSRNGHPGPKSGALVAVNSPTAGLWAKDASPDSVGMVLGNADAVVAEGAVSEGAVSEGAAGVPGPPE